MTRRAGFTLLFFVPAFLFVFIGIRALWFAYMRSLSESQLHQRVFDHSTLVVLVLWGLCISIAAVIARLAAAAVSRKTARLDD